MVLIRINKALADAGLCSRRRADALVAAGLVTINGEVVREAGIKVDPEHDSIAVRGKNLPHVQKKNHCYLMLHKPAGVMCTAYDPEGRRTVLDYVPQEWQDRRLYPAGRLDYFSEGLVLLTDDGDLTYRLTHPERKNHAERVYHVLIRGNVAESKLQIMRAGMQLAEGDRLAAVKVQILPESHWLSGKNLSGNTILEMVLVQGVNRQIRRMCRDLDLTILRLIRVAQGSLQLGDLACGAIRSLADAEQKKLLQS